MIEANRSHCGRYLSEEGKAAYKKEIREAKQQKKIQKRKRKWISFAVFFGGNALLLYMILNCLIDDRFGMAALIAISYGCGFWGR